jgi:hypothetical protein
MKCACDGNGRGSPQPYHQVKPHKSSSATTLSTQWTVTPSSELSAPSGLVCQRCGGHRDWVKNVRKSREFFFLFLSQSTENGNILRYLGKSAAFKIHSRLSCRGSSGEAGGFSVCVAIDLLYIITYHQYIFLS